MTRLRAFFRIFSRPAFQNNTKKASSASLSILALSMAAYSSTITKVPDLGSRPRDAAEKPHHITKHGAVVGYRNVHSSWEDATPRKFLQYIVWLVDTPRRLIFLKYIASS
jgi:hypothetical protein